MINLLDFTIILLLAITVKADFLGPSLISDLPFKAGMAFATINDSSIILFGGENATHSYTQDLYQLTQTPDLFDWKVLQQNNPPPGTWYSRAAMTNNNTMYLMGGITNVTKNQIYPLQTYQYSFESSTWTPSPMNNASVENITAIPWNRQSHSATYDQRSNKIYIYAGAVNTTIVLDDFFSYDLTTQNYTRLPSPNVKNYGHTASLLSDGRLVIIGGVISNPLASYLSPLNNIRVYDTLSNTWTLVEANNSVGVSTRTSHLAAVTSDNKIIVFGGDNGSIERKRMYLDSIGILDTNTWTWSIPEAAGISPSRRSYASGGLLSGNLLTVAFGTSLNTYYNDVNVFNISASKWIQSFETIEEEDSHHTGLSAGAIAGITIGCVAFVIIIILLLKFFGCIRRFITRFRHTIWKRRIGEPIWAETTRLIIKIILFLLFCAFLAIILRQAIDSPNIIQKIEEYTEEVQVPDARFCFDGIADYVPVQRNIFDDSGPRGVTCQTDTGYSCSQFVQTLDMSVYKPSYSGSLGNIDCFLFIAPPDFTLTATSGKKVGSRLLFTFWGTDYGRIHTSIYPKTRNPNVDIYNISNTTSIPMSPNDLLNWQLSEKDDLQDENVFDIEPLSYNTLTYDLVEKRYLKNVGWNYVGFLPAFNSTYDVVTNFYGNGQNPNYISKERNLGTIAIFPRSFVYITEREVKIYTLFNAIGFVGGVFGLFIAFQVWLFGFRPRSPWGVVHRWSTGRRKQSLLNGLKSKFKTDESGIPLVDPIHPESSETDLSRLKIQEPDSQRINHVEERINMLEMLFKAYYVDDEVFRSLGAANRTDRNTNDTNNTNNTDNANNINNSNSSATEVASATSSGSNR